MKLTVERGGERADRLVAERFPGRGRKLIARAFDEGAVRVNGRRAKKGDLLAAGDVVEVAEAALPDRAGLAPVPERRELEVLYEDPRMVAINKPPGLPSHPLRAGETGTLANAVVARWPECAGVGDDPREAGLAHRLDTGTSGVIVIARDAQAWRALRDAFGEGRVEKTYLALAAGAVGAGASHADVAGQPAETEWEPVERLAGFTLLRCRARTGRMHQVRVHLAAAGAPIAGDERYGGPQVEGLVGHFLHAERLRLAHPVGGQPLELVAPLPADRSAVLARIVSP